MDASRSGCVESWRVLVGGLFGDGKLDENWNIEAEFGEIVLLGGR